MPEAIVTLVCPETETEPAYTEVYRIEFDTVEHMRKWLDTSETDGVAAEQKMGEEKVTWGA